MKHTKASAECMGPEEKHPNTVPWQTVKADRNRPFEFDQSLQQIKTFLDEMCAETSSSVLCERANPAQGLTTFAYETPHSRECSDFARKQTSP